jgi:AcrR family transcriptional regulator
MRQRRNAIAHTRERIVAAAFDLHATIGPSRTTISGIADRAGVQRHTVYAHFPDIDALYEACTDHGMRITGMPDPAAWSLIDDPSERCARGIRDLAAWYRANERMLTSVLADVDPLAPAAENPDAFERRMTEIRERLIEPWRVPDATRPLLSAILTHAIAYTTWRSLVGAGLTDPEASTVLLALVERVADGSIAPAARGA